jgi:hypothetical protein
MHLRHGKVKETRKYADGEKMLADNGKADLTWKCVFEACTNFSFWAIVLN